MKHIKLFENFDINEGFMSDLSVRAQESDNLQQFIQDVTKAYPSIKSQKNYIEWLEVIYDQAKNEESEDQDKS